MILQFSQIVFFLRHYTSTLHILGFFWPFPKGYGKINALLIGILNRDSLFLSFCSWGMFPISNTYISVGGVHIVYMLSIVYIVLENSSVFPSVSRSLDDTLGSWTKLSRPNRLWFSKGKLPTSRALEWIGELSMVVGTFTQMEVSWTFRRLLKFSPFFFGSDQEEHLDQRGLLRCLWGGDDFSRWPTSGFFLKTLHFSEKNTDRNASFGLSPKKGMGIYVHV